MKVDLGHLKKMAIIVISLLLNEVIYSNDFTIKGKILEIEEKIEKVYLVYYNENKIWIDSSGLIDGSYLFKGKSNEIAIPACIFANRYSINDFNIVLQAAYPNISSAYYDCAFLFISPGVTSITHRKSIPGFETNGSEANMDFTILMSKLDSYYQQYSKVFNSFQKASSENNTVQAAMFAEQLREIDSSQKENVYLDFAKQRTNSPIALYSIQKYLEHNNSEDRYKKIRPVFYALAETIRSSGYWKILDYKFASIEKTFIGNLAPNFAQKNPAGKLISLSSFKGKYVLVDFWASWCGPCRKENPYLVKAYSDFKRYNFAVLGVSLDHNKLAWLKAIREDGLTWEHVSDLKYWDNEVALIYGIEAVPTNFLIDPKGKIIAKNLRGKELEKRLAEMFNK